MNDTQAEYLRKKIVDLAQIIEKLIDEKREMTKGYNETISSSKKKMRNFVSAVKLEDETILQEQMSRTEYEEFYGMK